MEQKGKLRIIAYTREDANKRQMKMIEPFQKYFKNLEVLRYMPSKFEDQVRLFSDVDVFIAPRTGANTNMLFMQRDSMYFDLQIGNFNSWPLEFGLCTVVIIFVLKVDHNVRYHIVGIRFLQNRLNVQMEK